MCLAIPGRVKQINGRQVLVEYPMEERTVLNGDEVVKIGDFVLVQMGIILKKIPETEAKKSWDAWKKLS